MTRQRIRDVRLEVWITEEEQRHIQKKMEKLGTKNMSAYLRKVAMDGYIIRLDLPELKDVLSLMKYTSNNVNQIARKLNQGGQAYEIDVQEICRNQEKIWQELHSILERLSKIS